MRDVEGFPVIQGRLGRIEWHDEERRELAVYTDRLRLFARLLAIPGVKRHQTGDQELRALSRGRRPAADRAAHQGQASEVPDLPEETSAWIVPGGNRATGESGPVMAITPDSRRRSTGAAP